jgi:hypothetical protein
VASRTGMVLKYITHDREAVLVANLSTGECENAVAKKWAAFALAWSVRCQFEVIARVISIWRQRLTKNKCSWEPSMQGAISDRCDTARSMLTREGAMVARSRGRLSLA